MTPVPAVLAAAFATSAARAQPSAGELLRDIEHLQVVGSVLYVAAHPDDENTRLIAWLERERGIRTAYLSMTRGGGGQNLIGPEQDAMLGVIRTGELLAARGVDGAVQRFTRMRDFGYSKSPEETLSLWGRDEAQSDVVRAVRAFRPDLIVTRFGTTGQTHGHHVASAILANEAFTAAADPAVVTEGLPPWAADRLLHNRSRWNIDETTDTSAWLRLDVGAYDPATGRAIGEIAAASRTMHKSQGMGSTPEPGPIEEFFVPILGTPLSAGDDPFAGLDLTWRRFEGTGPLVRALRSAVSRFDPRAPHAVLPDLARAHARMAEVPDAHWRAVKTAELEQVMADAAGLWVTARADRAAVVPGGSLKVTLTALLRAPAEVTLREVALDPGPTAPGQALVPGVPFTAEVEVEVPADHPLTRPHWLVEPPTATRYTIADPALRNVPETEPSLNADFHLVVAGRPLTLRRPVALAWTDAVDGERVRAVEVLPPVTATFAQPALVLPSGGQATTRVTLRAEAGPSSGVLRLAAPEGVLAAPAEVPFALADGAERVVDVVLSGSGPSSPSAGPLVATVEVGERRDAFQRVAIDYPHLPRRTVLLPASQHIVPVEVERGPVQRIGYVPGSGDTVAESLRAVGYAVEVLDEQALRGDLAGFDAIVMGIRAYNTSPRLLSLHEPLMAYVAAGGRLVVQYNTNNRFNPLDGGIGPFPFQIGRDRVTDESAALVPVDPEHPALRVPNRLGPDDFAGWVQERGLYFAEEWDPRYQVLFTTNDPGEEALQGSTLVARHGEGVFVYTGLSFFRQLPAGVPGAYRLLANLLALP